MSDNKPIVGYQSRLTVSNVSATSEQTAFPATNLANVQTFSLWKSNTLSDQYITVSHGTAQVDYIGIAGHNFDEAGCSVSVECQGVSGGDWVEIVSPRPVNTDRPVMLFSAGDNLLKYSGDLTNAAWVDAGTPTVTPLGSGVYSIEDNNAAAYEYKRQDIAIDPADTYTVTAEIAKDSTGRATRFPALEISFRGAVTEISTLRVDSSTGEYLIASAYGATGDVEDAGDYWLAWITAKSINQGNSTLRVSLFPAVGASSVWAQNVAAVGTTSFRRPQVVKGTAVKDYTETSSVAYNADSVTVYATRIKIASAAELPQMSILYVGKAMELPRRRYKSYTPPTYSKEQSVVSGTSESGQFLGRILKSESAGGEIEVKLIDPAWYRSTFDLFVTHAKTMPWFYAWRPQDYPDEAVFAWATNPIIPENTSVRDFMAATIKYNCIA